MLIDLQYLSGTPQSDPNVAFPVVVHAARIGDAVDGNVELNDLAGFAVEARQDIGAVLRHPDPSVTRHCHPVTAGIFLCPSPGRCIPRAPFARDRIESSCSAGARRPDGPILMQRHTIALHLSADLVSRERPVGPFVGRDVVTQPTRLERIG